MATPNPLQQSIKPFDFGESYNYNESDGPIILFLHVHTRETKKLPEPQWPELISWNGVPPTLPPSSCKSAGKTVQLLRVHLPHLITILRLHHAREKLDEKPARGTWTIINPRIGYVIGVVACMLHHARKANGVLPSSFVKMLNATQKIMVRAGRLAHRVARDYASNGSYVELYYEVVPKALERLVDLLDACGVREVDRGLG